MTGACHTQKFARDGSLRGPSRYQRWADADIARVMKAHRAGMDAAEIGRLLGINRDRVGDKIRALTGKLASVPRKEAAPLGRRINVGDKLGPAPESYERPLKDDLLECERRWRLALAGEQYQSLRLKPAGYTHDAAPAENAREISP